MDFTFSDYFFHIQLLKDNNYAIVGYGEEFNSKMAILRHDVDFSLRMAVEMSRMEESAGIKSTYFILPRSRFYNILSIESQRQIREILLCGHSVGLHFDETCYEMNGDFEILSNAVSKEKALLEQITDEPICSISMHRPSQFTLNGDFKFDGLINTYSQKYFKEWKYVSDSRMHWREDLGQIINCGDYDKLHILTHPFWYAPAQETTRDKLMRFINGSRQERYDQISDNFRDLDDFIRKDELR